MEKWKEVANTPVHESAIQRLLDLEESTGGFADYLSSIDDWEIQKISDAGGAAINLDYFSVEISKLPNSINSSQFLNYVRLNMFDDLDNAKFSPHPLLPNEKDKWANNPISSILSIDIEPPAGDGSVICIDATSNHWVFATIQDPKNLQHPVSGNRKFGIKSNTSGGYTFYTRGTDRVKVGGAGFLRDIALAMSDGKVDLMDNGSRPWIDLRKKVMEYINENGGNATMGVKIEERPDYDLIKDILDGKVQISELKHCE